jgi:protein-tyrosine phosphatase
MDRRVRWPDCVNARDLGGLAVAGGGTTRRGWLFRSDTLARLSADGVAALRDTGVTTVIDLREEALRRRQAHPFAASGGGPRVAPLPLLPEDFPLPVPLDGGNVRALDAALDRAGLIVREIVDAPGGVVFHCHSGTGRTGVLAALLLAFAGVPGEAIAGDYLLSLEAAPRRDVEAARGVVPGLLAHLDGVHGGAPGYLFRAGVDTESLQRLRGRLITTPERWSRMPKDAGASRKF